MPIHHLHIAMILGLAVLIAACVYLFLATGKTDLHPLKIARTVFLVVIVVNTIVYIGYYSALYSRWGLQQTSRTAPDQQQTDSNRTESESIPIITDE